MTRKQVRRSRTLGLALLALCANALFGKEDSYRTFEYCPNEELTEIKIENWNLERTKFSVSGRARGWAFRSFKFIQGEGNDNDKFTVRGTREVLKQLNICPA